jgi:cellobiose phosphorylase
MNDAPLHLANAAGLSLELDRDGGVRRIQLRDDAVTLFAGNGMEPGPANLWLRVTRGDRVETSPLLGPLAPLRPLPSPAGAVGFASSGEWLGLGVGLRLALSEDAATWCWRVRLENRSPEERAFDLLCAQDLALASRAAVRVNEYYVSQYVDLHPLEHARCGWVVAARQNLPQGGRHPWAVVGSLRRAASFATDGLQVFGLAQRMGATPAGLRDGLPGRRLQHEHAMAAVQDERVTLAPGAVWDGGFFAAVQADHPEATSALDLAAVDAALSWAASLPPPPARPAPEDAGPAPEEGSSLLATSPLLECRDVQEPELVRLFGPRWRHEERDPDGRLLSFFCGEDSHVVLREKEARTQRPHGLILRTGQARVPEEASLASTAWMAGIFHSMVTQGHVSINRFLSTVHGWLGLFRSHGLRVLVEVGGRWHLLGVPSAFEMRPRSCRWIYRHALGTLEVTSAAREGTHALTLGARVLDGPPLAWLVTLHVALGGDDGDGSPPIPWRVEGEDVVVGMPEGSALRARFPDGSFRVAPHAGTILSGAHGDARLFTDGRTRGLPWLALELAPCAAFGLDLLGRLVPDVHAAASPAPLPALSPPGDGAAAAEVRRLAEVLPWFLHDAQVHHLSPRGLEQYSGGGWGTRDACQGPLELLLALDCPEAARDLLLRVLGAQGEDGDWPQWFQFLERERELRAPDSHGDVVFWPVLATAQYVIGTGDASLLDARVPFHAPRGRGAPATVLEHVDRALDLARRRCVAGTTLAAYGHGDWNDALQPADPAMRDRLCSTWTVILHHQALTTLSRALRFVGHAARAAALDAEASRIRGDLRALLMPDGVLTGYAEFSAGAVPEPLIHPRDRRTGLRYSLLPMMHAVLEDLLTPEEAATHLALVRQHLWGPDGARLFDRPLPYHGGIQRLFQRVETSAFFGREIGLMYTHAHLRHAQALAHVGDARGLLRSLALAHPVQLHERLPQATLRQANCYFSSSDAAFPDRYEAERRYGEVAAGTVPLDGGWRVYSSGPGIALSLVVTRLLGLRRDGDALVVDPVIAPELSGLRAEVQVLGRRVQVEYRVGTRGCSPRAVVLDGRSLPFRRVANPYRAGGAAVPVEEWVGRRRPDGPDVLRVELT